MPTHDGIPDAAARYVSASRGDAPALSGLIESYLPRLRQYVRMNLGQDLRRRFSAEDIVQSVCVELTERADALHFETEHGFRAWLFKAALHKIIEKARHHHRAKRNIDREAPDAIDEGGDLDVALQIVTTPSRQMAAREGIEHIERAIESLSDDHREVIALVRIAGLPHEVVAKEMNRSVAAVRKLLGRALLKVSQILDEDGIP